MKSASDLAINGAPPAFAEPLHVGKPNIGDREDFAELAAGIFERGWLTNNGPLVLELESRVADYLDVQHCVAMCNGTIALEIAVQALEGGMAIAAIFAEHEQFEAQEVSLRAKVIKFSPNVLGKNWVTLQDGTGTAPDDKLVVTSSETVKIGDEVIVKGKVKSNVDIGAGYAYKVLLEEAVFSR